MGRWLRRGLPWGPVVSAHMAAGATCWSDLVERRPKGIVLTSPTDSSDDGLATVARGVEARGWLRTSCVGGGDRGLPSGEPAGNLAGVGSADGSSSTPASVGRPSLELPVGSPCGIAPRLMTLGRVQP